MTQTHVAFLNLPLPDPTADGDAVRVETTTLLPGGGLATVSVRTGAGGYVVSDDGAGRMAMLALGVQDLTGWDAKRGHDLAETAGLNFDGEGFSVAEVSPDQLPAAIAYVADACRTWAAAALDARAHRVRRDFKERTEERIRAVFPGLQIDRDRPLVGASTKRHEIDVVVTLPGDRLALFEALSPVSASMASVHMKFHDLMQAHADWPREAVVETLSAWASEDLAVMQQVSSHVRGIEGSWADLERIAA